MYSEPATRGERYNYNYANAVIGAKQPVPKLVLYHNDSAIRGDLFLEGFDCPKANRKSQKLSLFEKMTYSFSIMEA